MSQPAGPTENETSLTMQLLTLRGAISDLDISEGRLSIQEMQLQTLIAQYEGYMQGARASGSASLVSQTEERLTVARGRLTSVQAQLAEVRAQKEALAQQRETILAKLQIARATAPDSAGAYAGIAWPPATPWEPVKPRRRRWLRISLWLGLVVVVVALLLVGRAIYTTLPNQNPGGGPDT